MIQLKRELNELQNSHKAIVEERDNMRREFDENMEEAAEEIEREKYDEECRYNILQEKMHQKEKECIMLTAKYEKESRIAAQKEKEWENKMEKIVNQTKQREELSKRDR